MKHSSRREFLGAAGFAAGAFIARPSLLRASAAPASRVAIGQCTEYNSQVMETLSKMFDQLGGLDKLVRNKTVAIKINMTGGPTMKLNGLPVEMTNMGPSRRRGRHSSPHGQGGRKAHPAA